MRFSIPTTIHDKTLTITSRPPPIHTPHHRLLDDHYQERIASLAQSTSWTPPAEEAKIRPGAQIGAVKARSTFQGRCAPHGHTDRMPRPTPEQPIHRWTALASCFSHSSQSS